MSQLSFWDDPVQPASTSPATGVPLSGRVDTVAEAGEEPNKRALQCLKAADLLQKHIDAKHGSANNLLLQVPTRKRLADATASRREAIRLEQIQATLRQLAYMHQHGTIPMELVRLTSSGAIKSALFTSSVEGPLRALYNSVGRDERKEERILRMTKEALLQKIPGYFPTPEPLGEPVVEMARIEAGNRILEPSAGTGSLIDLVLKRQRNIQLFYCELNCFLLDILRDKYEGAEGLHFLGRDLMELDLRRAEHPFDRIIMNPPFERGQDAEHVLHAYSLLAPGGILTAIVSPGLFSRTDGKAKAFREFLQKNRGVVHDVPAGVFKNSGTGVSSKIICVQAPIPTKSETRHT
jgi:phospholipid N-methyltransferase